MAPIAFTTSLLPEGTRGDQVLFGLSILYVFCCFVSISLAQAVLVALVVYGCVGKPAVWFQGLQVFPRNYGLWNLGLVLWTMVVATWALVPERAWWHTRKLAFWLVPVLFAALAARWGDRFRTAVLTAAVAGGVATSLWAAVQYGGRPDWAGDFRVTGFQSHYMTLAGLLVIAFLLAMAQWIGKPRRWYLAASALVMGLVLMLSLTRSAWLGVLVGLLVLALLQRWQQALLRGWVILTVMIALIVLWTPEPLERRIARFVSPSEVSNRMRLWLWTMALRVVRDHPWLGTGPDQMPYIYYNYRLPPMPLDEVPAHFHNNLVQMAVDRGIPGLMLWLGWFFSGAQWLVERARRASVRDRAWMAGLPAVWVALGVAGLFEYNFGDSEVLMMWLVLPALAVESTHA